MEKALLADTALEVSRKRQADIDAGLVPDDESNANDGPMNGNGDASEVKEERAGDKSKFLERMVLKGNESDDEEDNGSDAGGRPSADKMLLCKGMPIRSVHTVEMIAIEKGWKFSCKAIGRNCSWPREPCKVHAYVVSLF